jgi:class 3 adenylate cyclase
MPLFMDRHDLSGVTPEAIAAAHARDLEVGGKHDVQWLTYWFDADSGTAFCLGRAPKAENLVAAHREAHGLVPNEIIHVSEDAVLRFLGVVRNPVDHTQVTSSFRAILFTDLEGSTAMAEELERSAFLSLLTEHDLIIRRSLVASRGREVKHTGDGIMAAFDEVANALECALAIQDGFSARIAGGAKPEFRVRIGMAAGEPVDHNDDLFGPTVSLASRICNAATPGDVLVSDVVHELGTANGFSFADIERLALKGFAKPVSVFKLLGRHQAEASAAARVGRPGGLGN